MPHDDLVPSTKRRSSELGTKPSKKLGIDMDSRLLQQGLYATHVAHMIISDEDSSELRCFGPVDWCTVGSNHEFVLLTKYSRARQQSKQIKAAVRARLPRDSFSAAREGRTFSFSPARVTSKCRGLSTRDMPASSRQAVLIMLALASKCQHCAPHTPQQTVSRKSGRVAIL